MAAYLGLPTVACLLYREESQNNTGIRLQLGVQDKIGPAIYLYIGSILIRVQDLLA